MTPREKLELRHIADTFFREARETTDGKFVIDNRSIFHLVSLLDAAARRETKCRRCRKMQEKYDKAESSLDAERDSFAQQIEDLEQQLKEFKELPQLVFNF